MRKKRLKDKNYKLARKIYRTVKIIFSKDKGNIIVVGIVGVFILEN